MIDVSGHKRNTRRAIGFEDHEEAVVVNCCGYQKFNTRDYSQQRTAGRLDYQIIYVFKGAGHYFLHNEWVTMEAGNIILFRPGEPQVYSYHAEDHPELYWIHFTGNQSEALLRHFEIDNSFIGEDLSIKLLFQEIILELQLKKPVYNEIVNSDFLKLLALIQRSLRQQASPLDNMFGIDRLIMQLNQKYMEYWDVSMMAEFCDFSPSYFSHMFKKRTGISPIQFLNDLRIQKAKELLSSGCMNISTVAALVGFEDALYFSRVFRRETGTSPTRFYLDLLQKNSPY
ncbi:MAG: AraC family transcriptional regulator [Eubacteriales bacterium]|nr:AraC family transcriptional regulator [Eubacteriales bacterium]